MKQRLQPEAGMTLLEMLMAIVLLGISMMAAVFFMSASFHGTKHNSDKDFATQKSIAILEELKSLVEINNGGQDVTLLDDYDDGISFKTVLTTQDGITDPGHASSGNLKDATGWKYERQVSVQKFQSLQANDVRLVNVKVFGKTEGQKHLLAETAGVIRTIADEYPPTQVFDLYILAIENVPGWWVYMANLIPFVANAVQDLQARNPGLEFNTHWIRTLAYGRDQEYLPYMNRTSDSTADIDSVYFYPATMPSGSAVSTYYVPTGVRARVNIDGTETNGYDSTTNPVPYAMADHFNHAMRLEDERTLFNTRVALGLEDAGSPTLRLLLEDMYTNPEKFRNSIIINVHGELFPFPPIRNFSDAAKDPANLPEIRAVTHPQKLHYGNSETVNLRVYSYLTDPTNATDRLAEPISVVVNGIDSTATVTVREFEGGIGGTPYTTNTGDATDDGGTDMYYTRSNVAGGQLFRLYRSPLKTPCVGGSTCPNGGIPDEKRLYNMDYIPSALADTNSFDRTIDDPGNKTKNTARWVISIDGADVPDDAVLTIETRIGTDLTTGVLHPTRNEPANLSRTYTWVGTDDWAYGDGTRANPGNIPITERYQFIGDPRHMPYSDSREAFHATNNPLGMGYNRYFDNFHNGSGNMGADADYWPGFSGVKSGSGSDLWRGRLEIDINRAFQIMRQSIMRSNSLWTTMTGFSYYYVGIGNEIGYDSANGFSNSIPVSSKPFTGASGSRNEQSITNAQSGGVKYIRESDLSGWWGLNWLGELYPDDHYSQWSSNGNLDTGVGDGKFIRVRRSDINTNLPTGTSLVNAMRRTQQEGSTTFFSVGTASEKFHHTFATGNGSLQTAGTEIASKFNFGIPDQVYINRPFYYDLNGSGGVPDNYLEATYTGGTAATPSELAVFYDHPSSGVTGSALFGVEGAGEDMGYVVVNGIAQTIETGSAFMSRWSMLTLLQSYMVGGLFSGSERINQLPRIEITSPSQITDLDRPNTVAMAWDKEWKRWDGLSYTDAYASNFAESTPLDYVVMYSPDNGSTWKYMQNNASATPGTRPSGSSPKVTTAAYSWATPANNFPQGSYIVRVEAYRQGVEQHYSYHQRKIYIKR